MTLDWRPEKGVLDNLYESGMSPEWVVSKVHDFRKAAMTQGDRSHAWSAKFFQFCKRTWLKERSQTRVTPATPISEEWQPGLRVLESLHEVGLPVWWATSLEPEFRLYWEGRGERRADWDLVFFQHCQRTWARMTANQRLAVANGQLPRVNGRESGDRRTGPGSENKRSRDISIEEMITDTSW